MHDCRILVSPLPPYRSTALLFSPRYRWLLPLRPQLYRFYLVSCFHKSMLLISLLLGLFRFQSIKFHTFYLFMYPLNVLRLYWHDKENLSRIYSAIVNPCNDTLHISQLFLYSLMQTFPTVMGSKIWVQISGKKEVIIGYWMSKLRCLTFSLG